MAVVPFSNLAEAVTIDSIDELLNYWDAKLVAAGHVAHVVNATTGAPAADRRFGRETIYELVNGGLAGFVRGDPSSAAQDVQLYAMAGWSGLHAVASVSQTGTSVTLNCPTLAALVQAGDFVAHNGSADPLNNVRPQARGTEGTHFGVVTSVSAPNVTYSLGANGLSQTRSCGAGGFAWAQYNTVGGAWDIGTGTSGAVNLRITEGAALTVVGVVDDDGLEGIVRSPGVATWIVKIGHFARTHLPRGRNGRGLLLEDAVGDGSSQVTVKLDRAAAFEAGQSVLLIPNDSAYPNTGGELYSSSQLQAVTIVSQPSSTEAIVVLPNHTFPAGSSFGADPMPLAVFGYRTAPGASTPINNSNYFSASYCLCGVTGSRATAWGTLFLDSGAYPLVNLSNANALNSQSPSEDGYYHCAPLMIPVDADNGVRQLKHLAAVVQESTGATPGDGDVIKTAPNEFWVVFDPPNLGSTSPSSRVTFIVGPFETGAADHLGVFSYGGGTEAAVAGPQVIGAVAEAIAPSRSRVTVTLDQAVHNNAAVRCAGIYTVTPTDPDIDPRPSITVYSVDPGNDETTDTIELVTDELIDGEADLYRVSIALFEVAA